MLYPLETYSRRRDARSPRRSPSPRTRRRHVTVGRVRTFAIVLFGGDVSFPDGVLVHVHSCGVSAGADTSFEAPTRPPDGYVTVGFDAGTFAIAICPTTARRTATNRTAQDSPASAPHGLTILGARRSRDRRGVSDAL
jgi:hypothetical protein